MIRHVYEITNNLNGKTYVGQHSTNDENDGYMGSGVLLKIAQKKYGVKNFSKKVLCYCENQEELNNKEIELIKESRSKGKAEYNISDGGGGFSLKESLHFLKKIIDLDTSIKTIDDLEDTVCDAPGTNLAVALLNKKRYLSRYIRERRYKEEMEE